MIILGYIFTILNYVCYCLSRFMKRKVAILTFDLIAKIFTALGLYCLNSLSGAYIYMLAFAMLIVANIKERLNKEWICGYILFQSLYFVILYETWAGISSALVVLVATIKLFSVWFLPPQGMRFMGGINSWIYLMYQISIKNWAGLLEIFSFLSNVLSYIKYKEKKNKKSHK